LLIPANTSAGRRLRASRSRRGGWEKIVDSPLQIDTKAT